MHTHADTHTDTHGFCLTGQFLDPEGGSQKATLAAVVLVVGTSSPGSKNPQGFLNTQLSATELCIHIRAGIAHGSTVSDFSLIF